MLAFYVNVEDAEAHGGLLVVGWEEVEFVYFGGSVGLETGRRRIKVDKGRSV